MTVNEAREWIDHYNRNEYFTEEDWKEITKAKEVLKYGCEKDNKRHRKKRNKRH